METDHREDMVAPKVVSRKLCKPAFHHCIFLAHLPHRIKSNAPLRRLIPYSSHAFILARTFAQPSVFPTTQFILAPFTSSPSSITRTTVLCSGRDSSSIFTPASGSQE